MEFIGYIFLSLLLVLFFAGMETAFVASDRKRLELARVEKSLHAYLLSLFYNNSQQFISTLFTGKYLSMVFLGWTLVQFVTDQMDYGSSIITLLLLILLASIVLVIIAELLPKTIFRIRPIVWLKAFSWILFLFYILLYPVSKIVSWLSVKLIRPFNTDIADNSEENVFSLIALNYLLQESGDPGDLNSETNNDFKIFQNVLDFSNVKLRDCLVPRTEMVALEQTASIDQLKQTFIETGLSKILIYKDDIDNIIGYIHSSEMFKNPKEWRRLVKKLPIVPENMAAQKLMRTFMQEKKSIAVVVDEFGGTAGIVTLEDIMEEIFGEIEDEHDFRDYKAERLNENEYLLSGRLEVEEANQLFKLNIPESEDYSTLAGFILHEHQHFPKLNEVIRIGNFTIKFLKVSNNRIELVKMQVN